MIASRNFFIPLVSPSTDIDIPKGAVFLDVGNATDHPELIFQVDTSQPMETRYFASIPMGRQIPENGRYLGMCVVNRRYILVFEVQKLEETPNRRGQ